MDRLTGWRGNNEWKDRQTKNTDRLKDCDTDRQTEKQTDRLTYNQKQRDGLMHGQMDKHTLIDRRIYRVTDIRAGRWMDRLASWEENNEWNFFVSYTQIKLQLSSSSSFLQKAQTF
jgi:hypothetical protein